jgi:two-component system nitrogen regulation response regulator GlnG
LRVLEEGKIRPVGGELRAVDVRVIAATNLDLRDTSVARRFRTDLFYRLSGITLTVPPLRFRREDIGPLFFHFVGEVLAATNEVHQLSPQDPYARPWLPAHIAAQLLLYSWPGNVRELRSVARRLVVESQGLPQLRLDPSLAAHLAIAPASNKRSGQPPLSDRKLSDLTEDELRDVLRVCDGDLAAVARQLRVPRRTLDYRLKQLGLDRWKPTS